MSENRIKSLKPDHSDSKKGNSKHVESLYLRYRSEFLLFAKRYGMDDEDILDAYQDAILIYFQKSESADFELKQGSPKTYLFSIGKHRIIDKIRSDVNHKAILKNLPVEAVKTMEIYDNILEQRQEQLKKAVLVLGESCRELLNLFYFKKCSIKEIKDKMEYKTENVVKSHKSRCIKKLKALLNQ